MGKIPVPTRNRSHPPRRYFCTSFYFIPLKNFLFGPDKPHFPQNQIFFTWKDRGTLTFRRPAGFVIYDFVGSDAERCCTRPFPLNDTQHNLTMRGYKMGINVLVVDGSKETRQPLMASLQTAGTSSVTEAANFEDAIKKSNQAQFDAVMINWNSSTYGDRNLVQELRQNGMNAPIFVIGTESENEVAQQTHGEHVTEYFSTPFDAQWLQDKLNTYLSTTTN